MASELAKVAGLTTGALIDA